MCRLRFYCFPYVRQACSVYIPSTLTKQRFLINKHFKFTTNCVYNDNHEPTEYNKICRESVKRTIQRTKYIMMLTYASIVTGCAYPAYVFLKTGRFYSLTGVILPGIVEGSPTETYLNGVYLVFSSWIAGLSLMSVQVVTGICMDTFELGSNLIVLRMNELSDLLEGNSLTSNKVGLQFKQIIVQILRIDR